MIFLFIWGILILTISQKIKLISDSTLSLLENKQVNILLFTLIKHQSYQTIQPLKKQLQLWSNQNKQNWGIFQVELSINSYLQQQFKIKRFPYLGILLNTNNETINYKYRNILTRFNIKNILNKIQQYFYFSKNQLQHFIKKKIVSQLIVQININNFIKQLSIKEITNKYLFNDIYSMLYFNISNKSNESTNLIVYRNGLLIKQYLRTIQELDIYLNKLILSIVNQFSQELFQIITKDNNRQNQINNKNKKNHIFVAVLDSIIERQQSVKSIKMLTYILENYKNDIYLFWMQGSINPHKKVLLGFNKDQKPPLFAYFSINQQKYPMNQQFSEHQIKSYLNKIIYKLNSKWENKILSIIHTNELEQQIKVVKSRKQIDYKKNLLIGLFIEQQIYSISNILKELVYTVSRINRFILDGRKQFEIILIQPQINQIINKIYVYQQNTKIILNITQLNYSLCETITNNLIYSIPPYPCILQSQMQDYLFNITNQ